MSAELEYRNGVANLFYAKQQTPWHQEGVPIDGEEQYDFAGLVARHFSYPLEKLPYFAPVDPTAAADQRVYVQDKSASYVWRPDTRKVLGPVGGAYEVVTNEQAFQVLKPLVDARVAAIETGGVLRQGADAWMLVRWNLEKFGPDVREVFAEDPTLPYAVVMANHDGRRGVMLGHCAVRICCANTLLMAERSAEQNTSRWRTVPHKHDAKGKLVEAAEELFAGVVQKFEVVAKQYRLLMNTFLEDQLFSRLVLDVVAPDPRNDKKFNPEAKLANVVVERAMAKRRECSRLWTEGKGHTGEKNGWYALNAAYELLDHNRDLYPTRAGSYRTASLLTGELARMKGMVIDNLVQFATTA